MAKYYFTKVIDKYFASWILPDTWSTSHPSDLGRFYLFVYAIHKLSKPAVRRIPLDDPDLVGLPSGLKKYRSKIKSPHRRTYDENAMRMKICMAIEKNHHYSEHDAKKLADKYAKMAIDFLEALQAVKGRFPYMWVQRKEWDLK